MAQKPDGKSAKTDRVTFTRPAADRIAKVVRTVEAGDRKGAALYFGLPPGGGGGSTLRLATFTGAWSVSEMKTVTLVGSTNTVSVSQALGHIADIGCERRIVFGSASGTQHAVAIEFNPTCATCQTSLNPFDLAGITGFASNLQQVLGHDENGCLAWYSTTTCAE